MTSACCEKRRPFRRLSSALSQAFFPTLALLVFPKCPMCIAVWIAAITGVTIGWDIAAWLRTALLFAGAAILIALLLRTTKHHQHASR